MQDALSILSSPKEDSGSEDEDSVEDEEGVTSFDFLPSTLTILDTNLLELPKRTSEMLTGPPIEDELSGQHSFGSKQEFLTKMAKNPGRSLLGVMTDGKPR